MSPLHMLISLFVILEFAATALQGTVEHRLRHVINQTVYQVTETAQLFLFLLVCYVLGRLDCMQLTMMESSSSPISVSIVSILLIISGSQ